jgi:transposase
MEASGSSHYWGRELKRMGHEVVLIAPAYIKPYVKRGKTDAADAAAICQAMSRPDMRFVPIKRADQQATLTLIRVRDCRLDCAQTIVPACLSEVDSASVGAALASVITPGDHLIGDGGKAIAAFACRAGIPFEGPCRSRESRPPRASRAHLNEANESLRALVVLAACPRD